MPEASRSRIHKMVKSWHPSLESKFEGELLLRSLGAPPETSACQEGIYLIPNGRSALPCP